MGYCEEMMNDGQHCLNSGGVSQRTGWRCSEHQHDCYQLFTITDLEGRVTRVYGTEPDRFTWAQCQECTERNNQ